MNLMLPTFRFAKSHTSAHGPPSARFKSSAQANLIDLDDLAAPDPAEPTSSSSGNGPSTPLSDLDALAALSIGPSTTPNSSSQLLARQPPPPPTSSSTTSWSSFISNDNSQVGTPSNSMSLLDQQPRTPTLPGAIQLPSRSVSASPAPNPITSLLNPVSAPKSVNAGGPKDPFSDLVDLF